MAVTVHIGDTSYTAATVDEVARRAFGATAQAVERRDLDGRQWGEVVQPASDGGWRRLAVIDHVSGLDEADGAIPRDGAKLADIVSNLAKIDKRRKELIAERNRLIRALLGQGVKLKKVTEISGMSRSQVSAINRKGRR